MSDTTIPSDVMVERVSGPVSPPSRVLAQLYRLARRAVFDRLGSLRHGSVSVVDGHERHTFGQVTPACPLQATITIRNPHTYADVALGGTIGVADAYRRGFWNCDDLTTLVRIFVLNRELLDGVEGGLATLTRPLLKAMHWLNRNTKTGSRKNIAAHYDLGNEFFRFVLDETMMYSCAYFERPDATLAEASRAKNDRICRKLQLSASDHLLEIGTGWGGFAIHAASQYGCRVTTTTISRQQFELAVQRVDVAGLRDRVTVIQTDYRDLPQLNERFDKLVSIEMIEAVGHHYFDAYFDVCNRVLKSDGLMLLQGITIDEQLYERAKRSVDFIKHFMFPGSCIPSVSALIAASAKSGGLSLVQLEDIGAHYVPTLQGWRKNMAQALTPITALGYPPDFVRLWEFYLSYCEGGFAERSISNVHLLLAKSGWRGAPIVC
ncbi:MAG: cyclopropane-fatty-acyl-phospholipid synthase family protein [Nitrospira sp.]